MRFSDSFRNNNDELEDIRRYEEYQRQKDEAVVRGVGRFLYKLIAYWFIWLFTAAFSGTILQTVFSLSYGVSLFIGLILSFVIFKIPYVKAKPFKSFVVICFVFGLFVVAFNIKIS